MDNNIYFALFSDPIAYIGHSMVYYIVQGHKEVNDNNP